MAIRKGFHSCFISLLSIFIRVHRGEETVRAGSVGQRIRSSSVNLIAMNLCQFVLIASVCVSLTPRVGADIFDTELIAFLADKVLHKLKGTKCLIFDSSGQFSNPVIEIR